MSKNVAIEGSAVPCGDLLNEAEEREYLTLVHRFLDSFPEGIPDPNMETWIKDQAEYYRQHTEIRDKYHPAGKESQAYIGVAKRNHCQIRR